MFLSVALSTCQYPKHCQNMAASQIAKARYFISDSTVCDCSKKIALLSLTIYSKGDNLPVDETCPYR